MRNLNCLAIQIHFTDNRPCTFGPFGRKDSIDIMHISEPDKEKAIPPVRILDNPFDRRGLEFAIRQNLLVFVGGQYEEGMSVEWTLIEHEFVYISHLHTRLIRCEIASEDVCAI